MHLTGGQRLCIQATVDAGMLRAVLEELSRVMMGQPAGAQIWLAASVTDLRKGFEDLSALVQTALGLNPDSGPTLRPSRPPR